MPAPPCAAPYFSPVGCLRRGGIPSFLLIRMRTCMTRQPVLPTPGWVRLAATFGCLSMVGLGACASKPPALPVSAGIVAAPPSARKVEERVAVQGAESPARPPARIVRRPRPTPPPPSTAPPARADSTAVQVAQQLGSSFEVSFSGEDRLGVRKPNRRPGPAASLFEEAILLGKVRGALKTPGTRATIKGGVALLSFPAATNPGSASVVIAKTLALEGVEEVQAAFGED